MINRIVQLTTKALETNDPKELMKIARELHQLGDYGAAMLVEKKAKEQKRKGG